MNNSKNEIIINSAYSFAPGADYICKITSTFKNNVSVIKHFSWADWENNFILEKKYKVNGKSNFQNLIKAIINSNRSKSYFYLYFNGMKQGIDISNVEEWQKNFIIFCLGGKDETKECYGKPFLNIDEKHLSKLFSLNDIFSFVDLYEKFLWYLNLKPSEINFSEIFNKYKVKDFLNFDKLLVAMEKEEEKEVSERKKTTLRLSKFQKYFDTHQHKIEIQYLKGGGPTGHAIGRLIANRSVVFFIEFYFRKNKKFPKGEHYISYFQWENKDKINQYEDFKNTEDKRVNFK